MSSRSLSIIIVNWNSGQQLRDCIKSIERVSLEGVVIDEVIVVDNCSTDGSCNDLEQLGVGVRLILNSMNLGFAAACNLGAIGTGSDYLLFLNPDTRLFVDSLVKPINFMELSSSSNIGICGIRLVDKEGRATTSAARFPSLRIIAGKILGLGGLFPRIYPDHLMSSSELSASQIVDQVIGAFFLIRKDVFRQCSGFDERFFVYFEEVDLSLRAKQIGYYSYFLSEASAFHKGGGCSERVKATRLFYSLRSRLAYANKHYSLGEFILLIFLTGLELPLRLLQGVTRCSVLDIRNTLAAYAQLAAYFLRRI